MNRIPRTAVSLATAVLCAGLAVRSSNVAAQNVPAQAPKPGSRQVEVEQLAAELFGKLFRAKLRIIRGEKPDPALQQDFRPELQVLIDRLTTVDSTSREFRVGMSVLAAIASSVVKSGELAERLGIEHGRTDLRRIDEFKTLSVKAIFSPETPNLDLGSGTSILASLYAEDKEIELKFVALLKTAHDRKTKNVALMGITAGGLDSEEAARAVAAAIRDPLTAGFAIDMLNEVGEVPPQTVDPLKQVLEASMEINYAGRAAELLSTHYPEEASLFRLHSLQSRLQDALERVSAAVERLEERKKARARQAPAKSATENGTEKEDKSQ